jgi:hypothetical protein
MTGTELTTFITGLNGSSTIDATLLTSLVETARAILEEERPWMVLRKTDTSKSASGSNTWQTSIDISTITDFSRFYDDFPVILFDGNDRREYYRQVPFDRRLEYKDIGNTFCFDENAKLIYLNGNVPFSGTLYINFVSTSTSIDLASSSTIWSLFPIRFAYLLGFYSIGIFKGAIDYDSINKQMLPENRATMMALKNAMETWDNERALSSISYNDPTEHGSYPRSGAINTND